MIYLSANFNCIIENRGFDTFGRHESREVEGGEQSTGDACPAGVQLVDLDNAGDGHCYIHLDGHLHETIPKALNSDRQNGRWTSDPLFQILAIIMNVNYMMRNVSSFNFIKVH